MINIVQHHRKEAFIYVVQYYSTCKRVSIQEWAYCKHTHNAVCLEHK